MVGRFITVEGGEGVGKSSFLVRLTQELERLGVAITTTREPGGTPVADRIRSLFTAPPGSDPLLVEAELMLVSAGRAQHTAHLIKPQLAAGNWVLSDRFADSTRVYQGYLGGLDPELVERIIAATTFGVQPDLTFVLDCDPEISVRRINLRGDHDGASRYDGAKMATHRRLREGFLSLIPRFAPRVVRLDASLPPETVVANGLSVIKDRLFA